MNFVQYPISNTRPGSSFQGPLGGFTAVLSFPYRPRTSGERDIVRRYTFSENGLPGIRLSNIHDHRRQSRYRRREEPLRITGRSKMSFRLCLEGHKMFYRQKHVLRQVAGISRPISVMKAAQCAAEVVEEWRQKMILPNPPRVPLDFKNLYLHSLEEIGGSFQIKLGYRSATPRGLPLEFSCTIQNLQASVPSIANPTILPSIQPNFTPAEHGYPSQQLQMSCGYSNSHYTYDTNDAFGPSASYISGSVSLEATPRALQVHQQPYYLSTYHDATYHTYDGPLN